MAADLALAPASVLTPSLGDVLDVHRAGFLAAEALRRAVQRTPPPTEVPLCDGAAASLLRWVRAGGEAMSVKVWAATHYGGTNGSYVLRQLCAAGLVTDGPHPHDRRLRLIRPTAAGRDYAARLIRQWGVG